MKKVLLVLICSFSFLSIEAQITRPKLSSRSNNLFESDTAIFNSEVTIKLDGKTKFTDYKIISFFRDATIVDTTLTIQKDFKFNYLRTDNFELLPFHNQGQTFNKLGYNFKNNSLFPSIGITAKQFNYYKVDAIYYYRVPTPTSEIMYRTGLEQGQVLDAFLTLNTSPELNISIAYKGLRSLGKYRHTLASHGNFRTTFNYHTKNKKYDARGHFYSFDLLNNENGGLPEASVVFFKNNDSNYTDRARLDVNFIDAESMFEGKRYYLEQTIMLFSKKNANERHDAAIKKSIKKQDSIAKALTDSLAVKKTPKIKADSLSIPNLQLAKTDSLPTKKAPKTKINISKRDLTATKKPVKENPLTAKKEIVEQDTTQINNEDKRLLFNLKLGHSLNYETQHYRFKQDQANPIFGDAYKTIISDHTSYQKMNNQLYLELQNSIIGSLKAKVNYFNYNYHYNSILYLSETINDKLKGNAIAIGAEWRTNYRGLFVNANVSSIIAGNLTGNSIKASIQYKKDSIFSFKGFAEITSKTPNFNKLLYQSDYKNYNWQNNFKNEEIKNIGFEFTSEKWGDITATYHVMDNYTYFNENSLPMQATETLQYLKVKLSKVFTYKKFTLNNTFMYQTVSKGEAFFRVPKIVTRNTLYYSNYLFKKKPLYLQTGVTFKYFTAFNIGSFNPLLNEFVLQNKVKIGNYPIFDFFVNAQIRRTRLFLKVENFSASFTGRNYFAAPNYPYRDLTVRFGLVWNWFI